MPIREGNRSAKRLFRGTLLLALAFLAPILLGPWPIAHAPTTVAFVTNLANETGGADCDTINVLTCQVSGIAVAAGYTVIVNIDGMSSASACPSCISSVTDTASNSYSLRTTLNAANMGVDVYSATASTTATITVTVTFTSAGYRWQISVSIYSGVVGFGSTNSDVSSTAGASGSSSFSVVGVTGFVYEVFSMMRSGAQSCGSITADNSQNIRRTFGCLTHPGNFGMSGRVLDKEAPTTMGVSWSGWAASNNDFAHYVLELQGTLLGISPTISQCYGNCGNPAVTTVNTNSTYSLNFNQSITIFYQAQSALQGTINNITAVVAKAYTNNVFFTLAIFRVDRTCTDTNLPFTSQCPGLVVGRQTFVINPTPKGKLTLSTNIAISIGQWFGIAFSATFSPPYPNAVALNDTNTNVQLYQAPGGNANVNIASFTSLASSFKPALYSWVTGTQIIVATPTPTGGQICAGLDCILPNLVNSFCTTVTSACQTGSSLFFIIVLSIITILTMVYAFGAIVPSVSIARLGIAELSLLVVLAWTFTFASFSLISPYVVITIFMMVALLFGRKVQDYI